jgi:hypothetical protein
METDVKETPPYTKKNHHLNRSYPHIIDGHRMGIGAEQLLNTLVCRVNSPVTSDNIAEFLKRMNRKLTFNSQFCLQLFANEQQRHVQVHWFRHSSSDVGARYFGSGQHTLLLPTQIGASTLNGNPGAPDPNLPGLNVSAFGESQTFGIGATLYAPVSRQDLEEMSLKCFTSFPQFNEIGGIAKTTSIGGGGGTVTQYGIEPLPFVEHAVGSNSHPVISKLQELNDVSAGVSPTTWRNRLKAVICDGGVEYLFENKHGTDAQIEVIVVKVKKGHEEEANIDGGSMNVNKEYIASGLYDYSQELGKAWVKRKSAYAGTDQLNGKAPAVGDVMYNPYYPLLPEDTRNADVNKVHFSQKKRFKFCLPSGAKRTVKIPFGGHVYDPSHMRTTPAPSTYNNLLEPGLAVGVIIAVNGQIISSNSIKDANEDPSINDRLQIVSRDMISGSNVVIMGEYYERVQACKLDSEPTTKLYSQGDIDPMLYPSTGWRTEPMQIIPSANIIRGSVLRTNIGHTTQDTSGAADRAEHID